MSIGFLILFKTFFLILIYGQVFTFFLLNHARKTEMSVQTYTHRTYTERLFSWCCDLFDEMRDIKTFAHSFFRWRAVFCSTVETCRNHPLRRPKCRLFAI